MIIVMKAATTQQVNHIIEIIRQKGFEPYSFSSNDETIITTIDDFETLNLEQFQRFPGVAKVVAIQTPYKLVSRQFRAENSVVKVGDVCFGGLTTPVIAGPCAVESYEQLKETALAVKAAGASMLRGGAYKPRTSPYSFQGLGIEGLGLLHEISRETNLPVVTEVIDPRTVEIIADYVDMLQVGARNMQNYVLLQEVAQTAKPVLLKRGPAATVEEWLMAAEYIVAGGNSQVVLCERGIRTFETSTRNTFDINAIPLIKRLSHLPVIADPSHGTGDWHLVNPVAKAALAAGADGLIIEVHPFPEKAFSDGQQSLTLPNFTQLMEELLRLAEVLGRKEIASK